MKIPLVKIILVSLKSCRHNYRLKQLNNQSQNNYKIFLIFKPLLKIRLMEYNHALFVKFYKIT